MLKSLYVVLAFNNKDPFDIIYNPAWNKVETVAGLDLGALGYLLKSTVLLAGLISIAATLIALFFINKADMVNEKKKVIESRLFVMFLAASAITFFDVLKGFFDYIFFL